MGMGMGGDRMANLGDGLRNQNWDDGSLAPFEKNFYIEHPAVKARDEAEADAWRKKVEINIVGRGIPKPCFTFEEASMQSYE